MKKMWLVLAMVLVFCVPVYANNDNTLIGSGTLVDGNNNIVGGTSAGNITANGGSVGDIRNTNTNLNSNVNSNRNDNTNVNTNLNSNVQGQAQKQGQIQGQNQGQGQSQFGYVNIETPQALPGGPSQSVPELNFGSGKMYDITKGMPNFCLNGILPYAGEPIREIVSINANVKFKKLFKVILKGSKKIARDKFKSSEYKVMVICAEAQKSWTTGGNIGALGSGLGASGTGGGAGAGSVIPQWGGTKADPLFTIIFVKVNDQKK